MTGADVCSHVKVVVRVRPENTRELEGNFRKVVQVVDSRMLVFDPKEAEDVSFFQAQRIRNRDINKKANKDLKFVFDHVFAENAAQLDVFENSTKSILESVLNGYNCTVFAYGATGAGKTHTMLGCENDPGVMYLTMKELFSRIEQVREEKEFEVAFSYLEVYNEQIRDLLANAGPLAVREDSAKGVVVQGLTLHRPKSAEHILEALDYGNRNRTQHPTDVNASSSRSHAVFQIYLRQQERSASLNPNIRVAKMSLIDLAGSERASATNAKGARFREGANINRSLLALGNVINALADPKSKKGHIPYRDSKLTRLLKDSLGGNCRTIMIANVSSSSASYEDTYNTLKYANRAKEIKSTLKSNVVSLDSHISQYAVICEKQRAEIQMLKEKLKQYEEKKVAAPSTNPSLLQKEAECKKMAESLQSVFSSRIQIRKECLSLERALKEIEMRRRCREECHQQTQLLCGEDKTEKATCKHERRLASLLAQQQHVERKLQDAQQRLLENEGWLHRLENEMKLFGEGGQAPQSLRRDLHCHKLQLQVEDLRQHVEHMTHLVSLQDQEHRHSKKIIDALLPAFLRHYTTIMSSGLASSSDESQYQAMQQLVQKERGVVWADQAVEVSEQSEVVSGQQELTSLLRFSHVVCHQSTPCSSEKQRKRTSLGQQPASLVKGPSGEVGKENSRSCQHQETPSMKQTRRKLAISPQRSMPLSTLGLQEALRQEGMFPLQYTPEGRGGGDGPDPNVTIDVEPSTINNATILISPAVCSQHALSKPFKRLEIPLLREEKRGKPSYMAMTSAAQRKRKLDSSEPSSSREPFRDNLQGAVEPKRVRQDSVAGGNKPMRVRRMRGLQEEGASRRVVRSVSEGNIDLLGVRKPKSSFLKSTQLFKRVTKRL